MAAFGLCLKLTHLGVSQGSLHISDVPDGVDTLASFRKAGPIYVPYLSSVIVAYTGGIAISFEVGGIRGFIDRGLLAAEFVFGPTFVATLPGPSGPAGGDLSGTYPNPQVIDLTITGEVQGSILYFDGTNWVQLPPGTSGDILTTNGPLANPSWTSAGAVTSHSALLPASLVWTASAHTGTASTFAVFDGSGAAAHMTTTAGGDLSGAYPNPQVVDLTIAGEAQGDILYFNGTNWVRLPAGTQYQHLQTNGVAANPSWTAQKNYGNSATNPVAPAPADGDVYYNTALRMQMQYDGFRSKWLSVETAEFHFGRNGFTPADTYYRGVDGRVLSATIGWYAVRSGTVVSLGYTRADSDAATFDIVSNGASIATVASAATGGRDIALNANFTFGDVLAARNQAGGNTTSDVVAYIRVKWRS